MQSKKLIKMLKADGWYLARITGDHHMFKHPIKPNTVPVPHPIKDLPIGTLRAIMKQAGLI